MKFVRLLLLAVSLVSAMSLAACGGGSGTGGGSAAGGPLDVSTDGESLAFKPATLTAKAGSEVTINFKNASTAQQHNFVLVKGGDDVAGKVDEDAVAAGAPDYVPADKANVVTNTKIVAPGASETVKFTAPAAGTYIFICTYPGHYAAGMKGTLTVN